VVKTLARAAAENVSKKNRTLPLRDGAYAAHLVRRVMFILAWLTCGAPGNFAFLAWHERLWRALRIARNACLRWRTRNHILFGGGLSDVCMTAALR